VRIGLVAGALVLLAAGYSHSNQAAEGPYSSADVVWLARFAGWDDEYSTQVQQGQRHVPGRPRVSTADRCTQGGGRSDA